MTRILSLVVALAFTAAPGRAADDPPAPDGAPLNTLVPVSPAQLRAFLDRFKVTSVRIPADSAAALRRDKVVQGILGMVMDGSGAAVAAGAAARGAGERDRMEPDLPLVFNSGPELARHRHMIFYDTHDDTFRERWEAQTRLLKAQLRRMGVPEDNISITPLDTREDFFCALSGVEGTRHVYFFGHGSPLVMHIGNEEVHMARDAAALQEQQVQLLAHYGCSFVDVSTTALAPVQRQLQAGTRLILVGHRDLSDPYDDRHADPSNPLVRVALTRDRASMHNLQTELTDRVAPTVGALLLAPHNPLMAAVGASAQWQAGEYRGRTPTTLAQDNPGAGAGGAGALIDHARRLFPFLRDVPAPGGR